MTSLLVMIAIIPTVNLVVGKNITQSSPLMESGEIVLPLKSPLYVYSIILCSRLAQGPAP